LFVNTCNNELEFLTEIVGKMFVSMTCGLNHSKLPGSNNI